MQESGANSTCENGQKSRKGRVQSWYQIYNNSKFHQLINQWSQALTSFDNHKVGLLKQQTQNQFGPKNILFIQMNQTQNSRATQSTIPHSPTQGKLNFSHRQPTQLTRKFFHANFNLSSSDSLKRVQKRHPTQNMPILSRRLDSVDTKIEKKQHQNNSQDSKLSKETIKKPQAFWMSTKLKQKDKLSSSAKIQAKQRKNQGQWIKPKHFNNKQKDNLKSAENQVFHDKNDEKPHKEQLIQKPDPMHHFDLMSNQKTQQTTNLILQLPNMRNQPKYVIDDDDFIKPQDIKQYEQIQVQLRSQIHQQNQDNSLYPIKQDLTRGSQATASQTQIKSQLKINYSKPKNPQNKRTNVRDSEAFVKIDSVVSCSSPSPPKRLSANKPSRLSNLLYLSPQNVSRDKRYSKFKTAVIDNEQKRKDRHRMILTLGDQNGGCSNTEVSPFIIEAHQNRQNHSQKFLQYSQLPPSHFSFNSQQSYVKKYQQLTSSPRVFQQALKDLRHVEDDQQHEYFKYEKNLKKQMYYAKGRLVKQDDMRQDSGEKVRKDEKKRRVSYNRFVEEIKKRPNGAKYEQIQSGGTTNTNNEQLGGNRQLKIAEFISGFNIPEPIAQARNESSLLSNPTKLSSQESKHDISPKHETTLNQASIQQSFLCNKNPQIISPQIKTSEQINFLVNKQSHIIGQEVKGLMFRKKSKVEKMKHKLQLIRGIQDQLMTQNIRINSNFNQKRNSHLLKFKVDQSL